jgi:hypothetical protein
VYFASVQWNLYTFYAVCAAFVGPYLQDTGFFAARPEVRCAGG